jgi:hypothetical protein
MFSNPKFFLPVFIFAVLAAPAAREAAAGHGGYGFGGGYGGGRSIGGFNFGGGGLRSFGGGHHYGGGNHYRQPTYRQQTYRQPTYRQPQGHHYHQPQYTPPRTNYVYPQPARPKVNVVPQVRAPQRATPKVNVVPHPIAKSVPPPVRTTPKVNVVPQPITKTAPPPPQTRRPPPPAPANPGPMSLVGMPTQADLDRIADQISDRDLALIDRIIDLIDALDDLLNQDDILDTLGDIRDAIADDDFGGDDLAIFIVTIQDTGLPPLTLQPIIDLLGQIAIGEQVIDWVQNTDPGFIDVPFGPDIPLVLMPGLPEDILIPLADGPVIIGMGAPGEEILLGTGNPFEVAGLPIPGEGAEPAAEVAGPFAAGQIIVANADVLTINYNLNDQPQILNPEFEQTLPGTTTWTIEFDRGNGFGTARYTLSEGYYYFKSTERGWELYKKTFRVQLDNADNTFAFNYVVDEQPQTIEPGASHDLTGIFPVVVRFDNGSGTELSRRLDGGPYKVAITEDMTMDIYKAEDVISPSATPTVETPVAAAPAPRFASQQVPASQPMAAPTSRPVATTLSATTIPAPQPMATVSNTTAKTVTKKGTKLPAGFTLFEPLQALTDARTARRLPPAFTLFRSAAEQLPVARQRVRE